MDNITKILFVTVDTTGGGAERMMFNIIRSLDSSKQVRLLITSDQTCPKEVSGSIECKSLGKKHASTALLDIIKDVRSYKPDYLFTTSSSIGYMLVASKYLMNGHRPKVVIRCAVPPSEVYFKSLKSKLLRNIIKLPIAVPILL